MANTRISRYGEWRIIIIYFLGKLSDLQQIFSIEVGIPFSVTFFHFINHVIYKNQDIDNIHQILQKYSFSSQPSSPTKGDKDKNDFFANIFLETPPTVLSSSFSDNFSHSITIQKWKDSFLWKGDQSYCGYTISPFVIHEYIALMQFNSVGAITGTGFHGKKS